MQPYKNVYVKKLYKIFPFYENKYFKLVQSLKNKNKSIIMKDFVDIFWEISGNINARIFEFLKTIINYNIWIFD